jgi:hypothetical protein
MEDLPSSWSDLRLAPDKAHALHKTSHGVESSASSDISPVEALRLHSLPVSATVEDEISRRKCSTPAAIQDGQSVSVLAFCFGCLSLFSRIRVNEFGLLCNVPRPQSWRAKDVRRWMDVLSPAGIVPPVTHHDVSMPSGSCSSPLQSALKLATIRRFSVTNFVSFLPGIRAVRPLSQPRVRRSPAEWPALFQIQG